MNNGITVHKKGFPLLSELLRAIPHCIIYTVKTQSVCKVNFPHKEYLYLFFFFVFIYFLGDRETECKQGRGRERGRHRI